MRKEIVLHFGSMLVIFLLVSLYRNWFDMRMWQFWLGGIIGTILPDVDHLIYVYGFRPNELSSQRITHATTVRSFPKTLDLLYRTRNERTQLIIHNAFFQVLFVIFAFMVIGARSPLAIGIALAFLLHLLVDQLNDFLERGTINPWFNNISFKPEKNHEALYWTAMLLLLLVYGFLN